MSCYFCCGCCCDENKNEDIHVKTTGEDKRLDFAASLTALLSALIIATAISTDEWLFTEEKLQKSTLTEGNISTEPESKVTHSGLWRVCFATNLYMEYECLRIDYFPNEEYLPDPGDSTMAIPYAVTKSAAFFFLATILLVMAEFFFMIAHVSRPRHELCVFVAGVAFTICGLIMLVGMIMYISVFKAEVGSKLRPRSSLQGPPFTYRYGYSFLLYVSGFITTEVAGTSAIFLYISWHQQDFARELRQKTCTDVYRLANHLQRQNFRPRQSRGTFLCERHQKRYFFGRESTSEDQIDFDDYLPPPPASFNCNDECPRQLPRDLTTQTMSTIVDVMHDRDSPDPHHQQYEFVTLNLNGPFPAPSVAMRRHEWPPEAFRRTTPV